jgi:glycosyltransferase involved in cell wall biosynthesis
MIILHFAPISWSELQRNGYRKTSGAMLKSLWDRADVEHIWYIQHDHRWGIKVKTENVNEKLTVIRLPIGLPYERFPAIRWFNRQMQAFLIKQIISQNTKSEKLIYWFYDWWNVELISRLPRTCTVMEITDLASHFVSPNTVQEKHLNLAKHLALKIVDYFFPVSAALKSECLGAHGKVTVLSNGIASEFLEQAGKPQAEPAELHGIPRPRLCVVSTGWPLNYRLDHGLLMQVLEMLTDWQLVLIGCERIESPALRELVQHPRVQTIGLIPLARLAAYIQHCDVCAAPYPQDVARAGDSLKVYEYLACGKPVVLSCPQGNPHLQKRLRFAFQARQFAKACQELLNSSFEQGDELNAALKNMTWEKRAQACLSIINGSEPGEVL